MFTLEQIAQAHSRVKSGADFPQYVQELIALGVYRYTAWLTDGHVDYEGADLKLSGPAKHEVQAIAKRSDDVQFKARLKLHQQGGTDYQTFCNDARAAGVERWVVDTQAMNCTYFDPYGHPMLVEEIPVP
jgi:uncharacterized protein YbcV (DUF1398 family)